MSLTETTCNIEEARRAQENTDMNIHTATTEVPENIKPMVSNAEDCGEAIREPDKRKVAREWVGQERRSQKAESDIESAYSQGKRDREGKNAESSKYLGSYTKPAPETKMATIDEKTMKKRKLG